MSFDMTTNFDILFLGHFAVRPRIVHGIAEYRGPAGGVYYGGIAAGAAGSASAS